MLKLISTRLALGIITLLAVSLLIFAATEILPGDVASAVLGQGATPDTLRAFRHELGLDQPAYWRYLQWLWHALHGDLGHAMTNKRDILQTLGPRFGNTMFLAGFAAAIAVPLAVVMGTIAAINEGKWIDKLANILSLGAISVPEFFISYLLILFLAVKLEWFPSLATVFSDMPLGQKLYVAFLPATALTMLVTAHMLRTTRSAILAVMSQPYIEMAFLKGLSRTRVVLKHALPNAASPIIAVVALNLAYLIVGVVVIEVVFVYPGVGQYMVDGVTKRDLPVIQACGLVFAATFITLNTVADILSILINPRLRNPQRGN